MGQAATQLTPHLPDQRSDATLAPCSLIEIKPEPLSAVGRDDLAPLTIEFPQLTEEELDLRENARRPAADCARTDRLFLAAASLTTAALGVGCWLLVHLHH